MGGADSLRERHNLVGEWIPRQLSYYECRCRIPGALTGSRFILVGGARVILAHAAYLWPYSYPRDRCGGLFVRLPYAN
jgi:hypothetical protein